MLNPARMLSFLEEKIRSLGTAACPPYHLAIVVGGTSAEYALKTAKYASAKYLDALPSAGSAAGHGFRDRDLEEQVLGITRQIGIGAQFGGKYFCHDVRVIRLPRHGASCPVAIAVSCSADRQALAKITADGVFLEQLETDPAQYLPDPSGLEDEGEVGRGRPEPADGLDQGAADQVPGAHPGVADRARWWWRGTSRTPRSPSASTRASRCLRICVTIRSTTPGPPRRRTGTRPARSDRRRPGGWTPTSRRSRRPGGSLVMLAKGNRSAAVTAACKQHGGFDLGSIGGAAARLAQDCITRFPCSSTRSSAWRRSGRSRCGTSRRSSWSTTRATTSSPTRPARCCSIGAHP